MKYYFECEKMAVDESESTCECGGETELPSGLEADKVICFLASALNMGQEKIHLITKEEYDEKYGDDEG